jgi:hypothetical protein
LQPFPVAKAPRIQPQDAAHLSPRIPLRQSVSTPKRIRRYAQDYALTVNRAVREFRVRISKPVDISLHRQRCPNADNQKMTRGCAPPPPC